MNISKKERIAIFNNLNSYGGSITSFQGVKGRVLYLLYGNEKYKERSLQEYYISWVKSNRDLIYQVTIPKNHKDFFEDLKSLISKTDKSSFNEASSRDIVRIIENFSKKGVSLSDVFSNYIDLMVEFKKDRELNFSGLFLDINVFIFSVNKVIEENKLLNLENIKSAIEARLQEVDSLEFKVNDALTVYDGIVWEIACAFWFRFYAAVPILDIYLNYLTGSLLFSGFWAIFFAGSLATFSVFTVGAGLKGLYNTGSFKGAIESIKELWNQSIADENSFHPVIDTFLASIWIASTWLYIDKLQKAAKAGEILYGLMKLGIKDFVFKYSTMHFYFTFKTALHTGQFTMEVASATLMGVIRGFIKNPLADYYSALMNSYKLSEGLSMLSRPDFQKTIYLDFWISTLPKGIFTNLFTTPQHLLTALSLSADAFEVFIVNLSSTLAKAFMAILPYVNRFRNDIGVCIMLVMFAYLEKQVFRP